MLYALRREQYACDKSKLRGKVRIPTGVRPVKAQHKGDSSVISLGECVAATEQTKCERAMGPLAAAHDHSRRATYVEKSVLGYECRSWTSQARDGIQRSHCD